MCCDRGLVRVGQGEKRVSEIQQALGWKRRVKLIGYKVYLAFRPVFHDHIHIQRLRGTYLMFLQRCPGPCPSAFVAPAHAIQPCENRQNIQAQVLLHLQHLRTPYNHSSTYSKSARGLFHTIQNEEHIYQPKHTFKKTTAMERKEAWKASPISVNP